MMILKISFLRSLKKMLSERNQTERGRFMIIFRISDNKIQQIVFI